MFIDVINFTQANLEVSSGTAIPVTDREFTKESLTIRYRPTSITMKNNAGDSIEFCAFTSDEWTQYAADNTISNLLTVADSAEKTLDKPKGEISIILAKASSGATLTSGATCEIIQE